MTNTNPIPLFNLNKQHSSLRAELNEAAIRALDSMHWILGPETEGFEKEFAALIGVKDCIACSSGASAIQIALGSCGIGKGDHVITSPFTFIATTSSISLTGAEFSFADVDPVTGNLDPASVEKHITKKTKAILPVHIYGYPADMDKIMALAKKHGLKVIEDCAQSHLAEYKNRMTGAIGHAGAFSFYPSKNLGACGDGGAVVTSDPAIAAAARSLRHCGRKPDSAYEYGCEGSTLRMDDVQAAILRVKLKHLKDWTARRKVVAAMYDKALAGLPVTTPPDPGEGSSQSYYVYTIKAPRRDELAKFLAANKIGNAIYYPMPLYKQPVYKNLGFKAEDYPNTEKLTAEVLSLPMFPELTDEQVNTVAAAIKEFYAS
ncbi:MAG: DegT/DnrJ/EryC1/StrS family aminotransferase [Elusimicrobiaceae bacterium]|nr:DegT/DnrJ/EryC1/StrS family aminotransferase [Elusimicrobiaceae bacterium]